MAPIATDPEQTFDLVLKTDQAKENPPTFVFRHLTAREFRKLLSREKKRLTVAEVYDDTFDLIKANLVGWRDLVGVDGTPMAFDANELDAILTLEEATELVVGLMGAARPGADAAKKSGSPSGSGSAASARTAAARRRAKSSRRQKRRS